jgi:hypothetical protein
MTIRKVIVTTIAWIIVSAWVAGGVWYFALGGYAPEDNCAHLAYGVYGDGDAAYDCAQSPPGK